ncbi:MAG: hypothetical protein CMJ86_11300 [Planctomycetes bacterium]|nr:hypothetical protein [Planctomycetota bacterium]
MPPPPPPSADPALRRIDPLIALIVLVGLGLRCYFATQKGLVLDEFHSDYHASRAGLSALLESVRADNHPPLSFLLISLSRSLLGDTDLFLRVPALIAAGIEFGFVCLIARPFGKNAMRLALALVVLSSLHLDQSSMARMYGPLAACITGATWASLRLLRGPSKPAALVGALCVWSALELHYFAGHYILWLGIGSLVAAWQAGSMESFVRRIRWPLAAVLLASLPWYSTGFVEQMGHGLPPGGDDLSVTGLLEAYAHLFFLNLRLGGEFGKGAFLLASLCILTLAGSKALSWRSDERKLRGDTMVLACLAWVVPLWSFGVAQFMPRSGFTWHYILPSIAPMAVLAAGGASRKGKHWALNACVVAALVLCLLNVVSRGTEDYPGAVSLVRDQWQTGDAVVCVEYQPPCFPTGRPWDRYRKQLDAPQGARLETKGVHLSRPQDLQQHGRIWLMHSALPESVDLRRQLENYGDAEETWSFGWRPQVTLFRRH